MADEVVLELLEDEFELAIEGESTELVIDEDVIEIIDDIQQGPIGPKGDQGDDSNVPGPEGPMGPVGPPGTAQSVIIPIPEPAEVWVVNHNLGSYPSVTTIDTQDRVMYGDVTYPSSSQVRIEFLAAFAGTVYLN